jgi:hypothetical protein
MDYGYWEFGGKNGLAGKASTLEELPDGRVVLVKDPDNPAVCEDELIVYALQRSRQARSDFCRIYPTLLAEEQERLTTLIEENPRVRLLIADSQDYADLIQHTDVTSGVHVRPLGRRQS